MWPFDRSHAQEYLRVGRHALERWQQDPQSRGRLTMLGAEKLEPGSGADPQGTLVALRALYKTPALGRVTLLLESAYLPVMLVDTGADLLRTSQRESLVRHRFAQLHDTAADPVAKWELRIEQRAGDRDALCYGLAPQVKQTWLDAGLALGIQWGALLPAMSWGWQRLRPALRWPRRTGWWLWCEQDRTVIAYFANNTPLHLDAGAPVAGGDLSATRMIQAEQARFGIACDLHPVALVTWHAQQHPKSVGDRVCVLGVGNSGADLR